MTNNRLKTQIKKLPSKPGIYLFNSKKNKPLYIGKALNLKNRVGHYLKVDDSWMTRMIVEATKIDVIETESDIEALILESQYIKKYKPDFNIMLRDDKQYFYVVFTQEKFPKIFLSHQPTKIPNPKRQITNKFQIQNYKFKNYIGPFTDGTALKTTLRILRKIFPYCTCKTTHNNYCLNYHIDKCLGFCCLKQQNPNLKIKNQNAKLYGKNIKAIKDILSGKKNSLIKDLGKEMKKLAKEEKFEEAMELQYKIEKIKRVFKNAQIIRHNVMIYHNNLSTLESLQKILKLPILPKRIEAYDIAHIQGKHATGAMVVFENGQPSKNQYRKFKINMFRCSTSKHGDGDTGMLKEVLIRRFNHPEWQMPDLIIVDGGKPQLNSALTVVNSKLEILNSKQYQNSKFQIQNKIPIIALTKDNQHKGTKIYVALKTQDLQRPSEALREGGKPKEIPLSKIPGDVKNLILEIDTEVHRFAINYYRQVHRRTLMKRPAQ